MNYVRLSDAVSELSVARKDDAREEYLRYLILAKQIMRDLKIIFLNTFKRVYLPINKTTNTVRLPLDLYRFRTISVIEDCKDKWGKTVEKVIPLTLNPYINITPQEPITCDGECNCEINHPVCQELSNYEMICEDVTIDANASPPLTGQRQTVLRLCDNGDIIKEVSEPTLKFKEGVMLCDYAVEVARSPITYCTYNFNFFTTSLSFPITITMTLNGDTVLSGSLANSTQMDTFFATYGWTKAGTQHYTIESTTDIWGLDVVIIENGTSPSTINNLNLTRNCTTSTAIAFPYSITSYNINGENISHSPADTIDNQAEQDAFFAGLGFDKVDNTHYTVEDTSDVYYSVTIETEDSPAIEIILNFTQSGCHPQIINDGYENVLTTDVLCNVELKDCKCIKETEANISTIVSCCSSFLGCCQTGALNNWAGWESFPQCCPTNSEQPYNRFGTYNIDLNTYTLYLDSVSASRVLLAYDSESGCDGDTSVPDYCIPPLVAGIAWKHAQYNEEVPMARRRELQMNYDRELTHMQKFYTDPIIMSDLVNTLKTHKYPY